MSFRLRSLILLLTAICLWLGYEVEQLRRHRRATLAVSFIGATASFAVDESPSFYKRGLRKLLGADVRRRIEGLAFGGSDDEFAALLRIPGLERIERLELRGPKISDKSLASAAQLASLSKLTLIDTRVTDRGLYALWSAREQLDIDGHSQFALLHPTEFEHQQVLDLSGPHLTDAGLADQSRRITMQALTLDGVEVTGSGFRRLQMLPSLRVVYLRNARRLDQNGIAALSQLPKLHALYLDGSAISDADIELLAALTKLQTLSLNRTNISDEGLAKLSDLGQLRALSLHGTSVTQSAVAALQEQLPELNIEYSTAASARR